MPAVYALYPGLYFHDPTLRSQGKLGHKLFPTFIENLSLAVVSHAGF